MRLADAIIQRARRTPYDQGHLHHEDGSLYMERYSLFQVGPIAARVHHIATPDVDRHLHDHPRDFVSIVLRGGYLESRPIDRNPCFDGNTELTSSSFRGAGSVAFRRATDRHIITLVMPDTWTLFITGPLVHWWGFYTPHGKIWWCEYADYLVRQRERKTEREREAAEILEISRRLGVPGHIRTLLEERSGARQEERV